MCVLHTVLLKAGSEGPWCLWVLILMGGGLWATPFPNHIAGLKNRSQNCSHSLTRYFKRAHGFQYGLYRPSTHKRGGTWWPAWLHFVNAPIHLIQMAPDRLKLLKQGLHFHDQHHIVHVRKMDSPTATWSMMVGLNWFITHVFIRGVTYRKADRISLVYWRQQVGFRGWNWQDVNGNLTTVSFYSVSICAHHASSRIYWVCAAYFPIFCIHVPYMITEIRFVFLICLPLFHPICDKEHELSLSRTKNTSTYLFSPRKLQIFKGLWKNIEVAITSHNE